MAGTPHKLLNKDFVLLWQGQFVSSLGSSAYVIAMMFWIKHATESASLVGTMMMAAMLPGALLGPLGGTIADRYSRKKIIVGCDLIAGVAVSALAAAVWFHGDNVSLIITLLFIVAVLKGIISAFFQPAVGAALPDLVPKDKMGTANSIRMSSMQISQLSGQGLGGIAYRLLGAPLMFLVDGVTYLFSAVSEMFITIPQKKLDDGPEVGSVVRRFLSDLKFGLKYVLKHKGIRDLIIIAAVLNVFFAPFVTLMIFYVEDYLKATPDWYGYLTAAIGAGVMLGFIAGGALKIPYRWWGRLGPAFLVVTCLTFGGLALVRSTYGALVVMLVGGTTLGMFNVRITTVLQLTTPSEVRGRVFGLMATVTQGLMPIGMGLTGVVADLTGQNIPLIYAASAGLMAVCGLAFGASRHTRQFLAYAPPTPTEQAEPVVSSENVADVQEEEDGEGDDDTTQQ